MIPIVNTAVANGMYGTEPIRLQDSADTDLLNNLTVTKTADKTMWGKGDGNLTYTIEINNQEAQPYTGVKVSDELDTDIIDLVADSVKIDDEATTNFSFNAGILVVGDPTPLTVPATEKMTITFQVSQVETP